MTWASLWAFWLLIPFVGLLLWKLANRRKQRPSIQFSSVALLKQAGQTIRSRLVVIPFLLKVAGLILVIVALARPQRADTKIKRNVEGIDIVVSLDISDSMLIEDMKPENRLESSKQVIRNFVQGRVSDRIGLVVFSGESYTRVPLTLDYPLLLSNLAAVQTSRNIKMGTAIGVALANAVARLKESTAKSRVVIFLTDGENNSGTIDPITALEIAKGFSVKIYSIGMGRDGQAQLPIYLDNGRGGKIKRYRPIHSKINEELLGRMASETGGKYYRAVDSRALENVFRDIDRLEKTKIEVNQYTRYAELYPPYLQWGLLALILSAFLGRSVLRRGP
ncbi:MAG: VWA domain-containing protein [Bdellovibrionaceae bacterium]|nr:VWA domain-containing protein [Bdellovibrionales bacterium]MCB9084395.1 VWA domain-containing protein [Pseudobdellovibrionaceae bacterium]